MSATASPASPRAAAPRGLLATLVASSRPLSWVNTAFPFGAAYLLTGAGLDATFVIGVLFFLVPYNLAMYGINDVFDYESDLRNPRKGGVEGALVEKAQHRATLIASVLVCVPFLVYLYAVGTLVSAALLTVTMVAVVAYSARGLRFKEVPFLDSATSATHFVGPAAVGAAMGGAAASMTVIAVLAAFFAWSMASQAFGAVQDIIADREGGLASIGTVLGARTTVRVAMGLYGLAALLMLLAPWPYLLLAVMPLLYVVNIWPFRSLVDTEAELAHAGWARFLWLNYVTGFVVTMVLLWGTLL
ncbi:MAG: prenyltransferase [Brachybacterium sp.]|nr:prenyltransferase [Brachybacterium sp.]